MSKKTPQEYMEESGHRWVVDQLENNTALALCTDCQICTVTTPPKVHAVMASKHRHPTNAVSA